MRNDRHAMKGMKPRVEELAVRQAHNLAGLMNDLVDQAIREAAGRAFEMVEKEVKTLPWSNTVIQEHINLIVKQVLEDFDE